MRAAVAFIALLAGCNGDPALPDAAAPDDLAVADLTELNGANMPLLLPHTSWVEACKSLAACGAWDGQTVSSCIGSEQQAGHWPPLSPHVVDCIRNAGANCAAVAQCLNADDPNVACDPATTGSACVGNAITTCDLTGIRTAFDCGPFGYTCSGTTNVGCGLGGCNQNFDTACVNGISGECGSGRLIPRDDCRMFGDAICEADAGICQGTGPACSADRCQGTTQVTCRDGHEVTFDCAQLGLTCVELLGTHRCGLGADCTASHVDSCNGSVLTYCDAGLEATMDCVAAGWKSCDSSGPPSCSP